MYAGHVLPFQPGWPDPFFQPQPGTPFPQPGTPISKYIIFIRCARGGFGGDPGSVFPSLAESPK